ncbi:unnamed protein product [Gadus morhua 'NCC']
MRLPIIHYPGACHGTGPVRAICRDQRGGPWPPETGPFPVVRSWQGTGISMLRGALQMEELGETRGVFGAASPTAALAAAARSASM